MATWIIDAEDGGIYSHQTYDEVDLSVLADGSLWVKRGEDVLAVWASGHWVSFARAVR